MVPVDVIARLDHMSVSEKEDMILHLLTELSNDLCPTLRVTGLSKGTSLLSLPLNDDLSMYPLGTTGWNMIALDVDKI
jgi:hypothetical protein